MGWCKTFRAAGEDSTLLHDFAVKHFVNRCPLACRMPEPPKGAASGKPMAFQRSYLKSGSPEGVSSHEKMETVQYVMDDFESSVIYGDGGIQDQLKTNRALEPDCANAYRLCDLIRDTIEACVVNGGSPSVLVVSPDFMRAFAMWGVSLARIEAGDNTFGLPINVFETSFAPGTLVVVAPLLGKGTAMCLSAHEVGIEFIQPFTDCEGVVSVEGAVAIANESHHAWVSGVYAFAAP